MLSLWVSEILPLPVVGLLPLVFFPLFGLGTIEKTASSYANPVIFLFLGGLILGLAIEKSGLHRRFAFFLLDKFGLSPNRVVLSFILCSGCISMWISNTATTMMMLPLATSVISVLDKSFSSKVDRENFSAAVVLSIALAANFGGLATLIGTPPNVFFASYVDKTYGYTIPFISWMKMGVPISILMFIILYFVLILYFPSKNRISPEFKSFIEKGKSELGKYTQVEAWTLAVFVLAVSLWVFGSFLRSKFNIAINDTSVAILTAILCFIIPCVQGDNGQKSALLKWEDTNVLPWGILIFFGGGLALGQCLEDHHVLQGFGGIFEMFSTTSTWVFIFILVISSIFISELMNNITQVIIFVPIVCTLAHSLKLDPLLLAVPIVFASSTASMLPSGTAPNAIAFSTGKIRMKQMCRIGFILNLLSALVITIVVKFILPISGVGL